MIARYWSARVKPGRAPEYVGHLREHVLPALHAIPGFVEATLLQRDAGEATEVVVITTWGSLDAIRAFAGDDLERAVVHEDAAAMMAEYDERVRHYDVVVRDRG